MGPPPLATPASPVAAVRVAEGSLRADLRGVRVVWHRELIRFFRNRLRIVTSLAQPILFLFVLGTGLASAIGRAGGGLDFRTFMFPGILAMTVLFTSIFSAISIVWDREFGFLREMLVAPVHRWSLVVGKCLGGATVATIQGAIMLALGGLVHVPYDPQLMAVLLGEMALTALALTAFGVFVASHLRQVETFQVVMQFFVLPMFFLSGAVFPLHGLPAWLGVLTKVDPLTYAVDPMRHAIFDHVAMAPAIRARLLPGVTWGSWTVPVGVELGLVALAAAVLLAGAIARFSVTE